ncbi:MAG: 50S ribosomal protein L23 [Clostridia bacterium]|nr:50S ribosomal protein L23 [Clostridia bacterium]
MVAEDIILAPVVTEKSSADIQEGKYTFKVAKNATKVDIKNAVEKLFEVKILKVNTLTVRGKEKRVGVHQGKTSDWKKAIVTIDTNASSMMYLDKGGKEVKISKKYKDSISEFMS